MGAEDEAPQADSLASGGAERGGEAECCPQPQPPAPSRPQDTRPPTGQPRFYLTTPAGVSLFPRPSLLRGAQPTRRKRLAPPAGYRRTARAEGERLSARLTAGEVS